jgi:hypothetical protein
MDIKLSWAELKQVVSSRRLELQAFEQGGSWKLFAFDDKITFISEIDETDDQADFADFQTNYQASANKRPKQKTIPSIGTDDATLNTIAVDFEADLDTETVHDHVLTKEWYFKSGVMEVDNFARGDFMAMQIVDKDNLLGLGAEAVLSEYVGKWFIMSGPNYLTNEVTGKLPVPGLYLRFKYTSVATSGSKPHVYINLINYLDA